MRAHAILLFLTACLLSACSKPATTPAPAGAPPISAAAPAGKAERSILVLAAASLSAVIKEINAAYEQAHPGVKVDVSLAGSQQLRTQVESGAAADVFLSANQEHADELFRKQLCKEPEVFVHNELALAVSAKSGKVKAFGDLLNEGVGVVICAKDVPAGKYAEKALDAYAKAGHADEVEKIRARIVSRESNVENATMKVQLGEADAGFVYQTDLKRANLPGARLPQEMRLLATYAKCVLTASQQPEEAQRYLQFLGGPEAKEALERAGFTMP